MKLLNIIEFVATLFLVFTSLAMKGAASVFIFVISLSILVCIAIEMIADFRSRNRWGECTQCKHHIYEVGFERNGKPYLPDMTPGNERCIECINPELRRS